MNQRPMNGFSYIDRIENLECGYRQILKILNAGSGFVQLRISNGVLQYKEFGEIIWQDLFPLDGSGSITELKERVVALENGSFS